MTSYQYHVIMRILDIVANDTRAPQEEQFSEVPQKEPVEDRFLESKVDETLFQAMSSIIDDYPRNMGNAEDALEGS